MDDKMDDDSKEKLNKHTSEISKEKKVVKKVIAQNKTTNVLKSNPKTTSQLLPKSSQIKSSTTPIKSKVSTFRASSAMESRKDTTMRKPLGGVNTTRKTTGTLIQPNKGSEIKKPGQTERRPISGISKPLTKSSALQI